MAPVLPSSSLPLFVYGTLLFPEVLDDVLGRVPDGEPATLPGWRAARLVGRPYPGLVPAGGAVAGRVLLGLRLPERQMIHDFEDDLYDLVEVRLADGRGAATYAWRDAATVLPDDWDPERFAAHELDGWLTGGG